MGFQSVRFYQYRNLSDAEVRLDAPEIFLIGDNGQGKTNFIESIYFLCFGSSFRTNKNQRLIRSGCGDTLVEGIYSDEGYLRKISIKLSSRQKREIRIDSKIVQDRKELIEKNPCIVFSHRDMEFVYGLPERRRWFFNQTQSLLDPLFIDLLRGYRKVLKNRNRVLKEKRFDLLEIYDQKLIELGWQIQQKRSDTVSEFNRTFVPVFGDISGMDGELRIVYRPSWMGAETLEETLQQLNRVRESDKLQGTTTSGPHRDSITFECGKEDFSHFASTGQIRLLSLILKGAQAIYYQKQSGKKPVLLLDDVLLELDTQTKKAFLKCLPEYEQAIFTFLPEENYLGYSRRETIFYSVEGGNLTPWKEPVRF